MQPQDRKRLFSFLRKKFPSTRYGFVPGKNAVPVGWPLYDSREVAAVLASLLDGRLSQGRAVREFEQQFAAYLGIRHGVAVNSGSSANLLALATFLDHRDIRPGDEVILPAATFSTVASPVIQLGLVPVYVDVDPDSLNISPDEVRKAVGDRTRLLMPVHSLGRPADMDELMHLAGQHSLKVLEDCCEAHGAALHGKKVGSFGEMATYSFFVAHNITTGEGGMVLTNDEAYERLLRSLREFGRVGQVGRFTHSDPVMGAYDNRYLFERLGFNLRMTDLEASFGLEQLKKLDRFNGARQTTAAFYSLKLRKFNAWLRLPEISPDFEHTFYAYPIVIKKGAPFTRAQLTQFLEARKIETRPFFAGCLPDQPGFRNQPMRVVGNLEHSRHLRDHAFFVGCHQAVDARQRKYVADCFAEFLEKK